MNSKWLPIDIRCEGKSFCRLSDVHKIIGPLVNTGALKDFFINTVILTPPCNFVWLGVESCFVYIWTRYYHASKWRRLEVFLIVSKKVVIFYLKAQLKHKYIYFLYFFDKFQLIFQYLVKKSQYNKYFVKQLPFKVKFI